MAERVIVMYAGRKVEEAPVLEIFARPLHPYTRGLIGAVPKLGSSLEDGGRGKLAEISGLVPSLRQRIVGCPFAGRCELATELCRQIALALEIKADGHWVAWALRRTAAGSMSGNRPLLEVNALKKHFPIAGGLLGLATGYVYAVDGVSFDINRGETLSIVGESGCGKSTVGKAILRLFPITEGEVYLDGERIDNMPAAQLRPIRQRVQVVFQDPFSSLNPRMRVREILAEPITNFGLARGRRAVTEHVEALMDKIRCAAVTRTQLVSSRVLRAGSGSGSALRLALAPGRI